MSKRILFLYSDPKYKGLISECEAVIKAVLRKFRKSVIFSYQYVDLSPCLSEKSASDIFSEAEKSDAVIWHSGKESYCKERIFATDTLGVFAQEQFIGGRCICSPLSKMFISKDDENISIRTEISPDNISKTVALAHLRAAMRKHFLLLCTDEESAQDNFILREFENSLDKAKTITSSYQDFNELILESIYKIPAFDVLLTTEECARIIALNLSSLQRVPCGSILWHGEKMHIYRREILPHEDMSNSAYASFLLTCADALCNDLNEKSAGDRLRRSSSLALEHYGYADREDFLKEVIRQINMPIRNRQVISDDSDN